MRTARLALGFVLVFGCGGRSSLGVNELGSGNGEYGNASGGTFATLAGGATSIDAGGAGAARGEATGAAGGFGAAAGGTSSAGESSRGVGHAGMGGALAVNVGGGSGFGGTPSVAGQGTGGSIIMGLEIPPWDVLRYNAWMDGLHGPRDVYDSVWSDGPERAWFTARDDILGSSMKLMTWDGALGTELTCTASIATIQGISRSDLWLAGCAGGLLHGSEATWSPMTEREGSRVWENSATDVWSCCEVTGTDSAASAFHWDGSTWTAVPLPSAKYRGGALWSAGAKELWIADQDVLHWDGEKWSTFTNLAVAGWSDVWGDGTNVWAVGPQGTLSRWNGTDFETLPTQWVEPEGSQLTGVWGNAPNDVWFVGMFSVVLHWDGTKLTREPIPIYANLFGVWGAGGVLWITGSQETLLRRTLVSSGR